VSAEAGRRLLHLSSGGLALIAPLTSWSLLRSVLAAGAVLFVFLEVARLRTPRLDAWLRGTLPVYRARERTRPSGAMWLLIGYGLAALSAPPAPIAGILVAACADPAASLVGSRIGGRPGGVKTLRGSATHWLVAAGVLAVLGWSWSAVLLGASVASLVEHWPLGLDDNLVVPPATALTVMLAA
jgi:dolichol kinase